MYDRCRQLQMTMSKYDTIALISVLTITLNLWLLKAVVHFDYLKVEKNKLKRSKTLLHLIFSVIFRPLYFLYHLWDVFSIVYIPILWNIGTSRYRLRIAQICYGILGLWATTIGYYLIRNALT